jgi:segregation and condensation protein B
MEFDPSATVETVVIDADAQEVSEIDEETTEVTLEETSIEVSEEEAKEVTPESEDNPDETK